MHVHPEIWEVILTGGDPLILAPRRLREVMQQLSAIPHVKVVRVHTRVPVADPARITPELVRALKVRGKATYVVLHANHARELTPRARTAWQTIQDDLQQVGANVLDQDVVVDKNLITSRKPADIPAFIRESLKLLEKVPVASR